MKKFFKVAGAVLVGQACFMLVLVLERLSAAFVKLYMFHFEWPQPIFLSLEMVVLFLGYSAVAIASGAWLAKVASGFSPRTRTAARWAMGINVGGVIVVGLMIIARLAVLSGKL
jgi:Na+/melibiose symporter-like transporter